MGRAPCCDKANVKKGPWSSEEDAKLKSYIEQHGTGGNWITLPQKIGLKRCGKSCRLRWLNYLRPNIKHGGFSEEEDNIICSLYMSIGSRWSIIAAQLPGRTDNDIKNYWNTRLKKKLLGKPRKDHQNGRRAPGGLKQEARIIQNENFTGPTNNGTCQAPYWPELPAHFYSNHDHRVPDDRSSVRKFVIKLSGRFANEDAVTVQNPFGVPYSTPHVYDNLQDLIDPSALAYSFTDNSSSLERMVLQGTSDCCFNPELDEMLCSSLMKIEGMDSLCGGAVCPVRAAGSARPRAKLGPDGPSGIRSSRLKLSKDSPNTAVLY
ncbi:unnamed protein product [Spirodela intermedia]|uniref:Uncharacterized protein n=1 Tax=Spirodela intermedia TaxID=51605 RepID=A0A7I8IJX3_SPIIN|nr:unnamed protein product [Spirodela intermedia]CAA6657669.1 unnamed protein product [Spirodela intermedia]